MIYLYLFVYSSILFSFIHVAAQSFPICEKFLFRFSKCDYCGKSLKLTEILPIISYLFQKGKSNCCKQKLKRMYIVIEIISPTIILVFYSLFRLNYDFFLITLIFIFLTFFVLTDLYYLNVPTSIIILFFICSLIFSLKLTIFEYMLIIMTNICIYFICKKGIGNGDLYILIILGFFFGFKGMYIIFLFAVILATIVIGIFYFLKEITRNTKIPFVPFIYTGFLIYIFYFFPKG